VPDGLLSELAAASSDAGKTIAGIVLAGSAVDLTWLAAEQPACAETRQAATSTALRISSLQMDGKQLLCDSSSGALCPHGPVPYGLPSFLLSGTPRHQGISLIYSSPTTTTPPPDTILGECHQPGVEMTAPRRVPHVYVRRGYDGQPLTPIYSGP
jgi:hypothetical protein